jgi:hypothetical protein
MMELASSHKMLRPGLQDWLCCLVGAGARSYLSTIVYTNTLLCMNPEHLLTSIISGLCDCMKS